MRADRRAIGGTNNKRGNRYEDYFATYKLIRAANEHTKTTDTIRMREQAGCAVDDLVSLELGNYYYYQLKANKTITWGTDDGKLQKEFRQQKYDSESSGENFRLFIVVNDDARKDSFEKYMPDDLASVTDVILFPEVGRIKELLLVPALLDEHLAGVCALRHPRKNTYQ